MDNKSFCIYPWIHMYVNPDGSVLPCCVGEYDKHLGNVRENTIEEIWNNDSSRQATVKASVTRLKSGFEYLASSGLE